MKFLLGFLLIVGLGGELARADDADVCGINPDLPRCKFLRGEKVADVYKHCSTLALENSILNSYTEQLCNLMQIEDDNKKALAGSPPPLGMLRFDACKAKPRPEHCDIKE